MIFLEFKNVSKGYGQGKGRVEVLKNINLKVAEGDFVAIVGFSGSGKTTLISLLSGLLAPDEGEILLRGKPVTGPGFDRGVVFQNYSLLPWLSVRGNVALGVDRVFKEWPVQKRRQHVEKYIQMVNLSAAIEKRPAELSGGMRQRVAVARALALNPDVLLLDEPLSALDALTRGALQREIELIWQRDRKTVVLITNDVDEGLLLADRVIALNPGKPTTLGLDVAVDFARSREKAVLNSDPHYKRLRNDIIEYLIEVGAQRQAPGQEIRYTLPDLKPLDLNEGRHVVYNRIKSVQAALGERRV